VAKAADLGTPGDRLALRAGAQILALEIAQLVLPGEINGGVPSVFRRRTPFANMQPAYRSA
jgi:hypothetical protein